MSYTLEDARAAVAKGVKLLDEKQPGWRRHVRPECLQMKDVCHCVLGQTCGSYNEGQKKLFPGSPIFKRFSLAEEHGFDIPDAGDVALSEDDLKLDRVGQLYNTWYALLDQAWREELTKER